MAVNPITEVTTRLSALRCRIAGLRAGIGLRAYGFPVIDIARGALIQAGERLVLVSKPQRNAVGVYGPCILRAQRPGATITIGDDVGMSGVSIVCWERISVGSNCLIGANVVIMDTDLHPLVPQGRRYGRTDVAVNPVHIGDNVFVGMGTMILKGVSIGENSVIGAGSVVTSDIPASVVAAGNPCRVIRPIAVHGDGPIHGGVHRE